MDSIVKWLTKKSEYKNKNGIRVSRLSTVSAPFLDEDIGMLDKEQIKIKGFIDLIDDKKC
ncbi:hypothetical protein Xvie_00643 [Xenorhabdus vietnamensis]|uniref:Uncharacterized protein n=1 Tax=Xenorhabdus vietnamensis TaxID=351656 RepID=A0A1Y2SJ88_9GAMM|nr:hypothetical protein [Xenorhabdus vietnamensis]OTA17965.1 hypothetical protein Xvie_00643 [Xenorhabdus vietnamensis]